MLGEAVALAVLGAVSGRSLVHTDAATVVTAGLRLGIVAALAFLITALTIAVSAPWPYAALRRVALIIAIVFTVFFVVGGAYYPGNGTTWQTNAATAFLFAALAIAGFAEFVLLNSENFDPDPGSIP